MVPPDSVLAKFQKESDFVLGYADYNNTWGGKVYYYLLSRKNKKWSAYLYTIKDVIRLDSNGKPLESFHEVRRLDLGKYKLDTILSSLRQNEVWKLRCDERVDFLNPCPKLSPWNICSIHDANSRGSIIMTKEYSNASSFYAPEYYEYECCPGNEERQRFLNTIAPIFKLFQYFLKQ